MGLSGDRQSSAKLSSNSIFASLNRDSNDDAAVETDNNHPFSRASRNMQNEKPAGRWCLIIILPS